jgi:hypothetical protein
MGIQLMQHTNGLKVSQLLVSELSSPPDSRAMSLPQIMTGKQVDFLTLYFLLYDGQQSPLEVSSDCTMN